MIPRDWIPADFLTHPLSPLLLAAAGLALIFAGRKLYWLFVGILGAVGGLWLADAVLGLQSGTASLVAAAAAGVSGAILAVLIQKVMVSLLGALAGLWGAAVVLDSVALPTDLGNPDLVRLVVLAVGAVLGAFVAARLFEAALIVLSALAGAALLTAALDIPGTAGIAALTGFTALGLLIQGKILGRPGPRRDQPTNL